jgi:hypothetical protein
MPQSLPGNRQGRKIIICALAVFCARHNSSAGVRQSFVEDAFAIKRKRYTDILGLS